MLRFSQIRKKSKILMLDENGDEPITEETENMIVSTTEESAVQMDVTENEETSVSNDVEMIECKKKSIAEVQQEYFELFGHETETIYDLYQTKEVLRSKIRLILGSDESKNELESLIKAEIKANMGEDNVELELLWNKMINLSINGNSDDVKEVNEKIKTMMGDSCKKLQSQVNKKIKQIRNNERKILNPLVDKIWNLKEFSGNKWLLMSPIYLCLARKKFFNPIETALQETNFSIFPVFRIRKCVKETKNSAECCAFFVDLNGRVYEHFTAFKMNNKYPPGTIVAPKNGIYNGIADATDDVNASLEVFVNHTKLTTYLDTGTSIIGLTTAGITAVSLVPAITVAPMVILGSAVAGLSCAAYSGVRSIYHLYDRNIHRQSNSIIEAEARAAYFTITGGLLCAGAAGVTKLLTTAAESGRTITTLATNAVNVVNGTSIVVNAFAPVDGIYSIIVKFRNPNEKISAMECLQVSASLFLFTHSVYNFQTAKEIIKSSRTNTIEAIRSELTNSQRKGFDKVVKETIRVRGVEAGQQDIIRTYRNVDSAQFKQTLTDVFKMKKDFRENEINPSISPEANGNILLNNGLSVKSDELRTNLKGQAAETVFENVPKNTVVPDSEALSPQPASPKSALKPNNNPTKSSATLTLQIVVKCAFKLTQLVPTEDWIDIKATLQKKFETLKKDAFEAFVNFVQYFHKKYSKQIDEFMHEHYEMVKYIKTIYNQIDLLCRQSGESIQEYILRKSHETFAEVEQKVLDFFKAAILTYLGNTSTKIVELLRAASNVRRIFKDETVSTSNRELMEVLEFVITNFVDDRNVQFFFVIAIRFIDLYSDQIMNMLKRYISLDTFVMDIYNIVARSGSNCDEIIRKASERDFVDLEITVMDYYIDQQPAGGKFIDCNLCGGKFYRLDSKKKP